jgi:uncharacterized membrane protein YccC
MADTNPPLVGLTDHPRAARSIRQIKAWGGLIGFVGVVAYSTTSGMPLPDALLRGVIAGVAAQMLAWVAAVVLWHHLLDGEASAAVKAAREKRVRDLERAAAARSSSGPSA